MKNQRFRIAIQKSGRLSEVSLALLEECGIHIKDTKTKLLVPAANFALDVLFLRDDDIPQYVQDGIADAGILGENVVEESGTKIKIVKKLDFAHCRLSLAVPRSVEYEGLSFFQNKRIATSYPNLLQKFLKKNNIKSEIHEISGSVEIAPNIGLAEGIADLVSSGSTLLANGLKEVEVIFQSEAVLVASAKIDAAKKAILDTIIFRLNAVRAAKSNKYVLLNAPNDAVEKITKILPGMKSPTVLPLAESGWSSVHTVVNEDRFWDVIDELKKLGAQGILVVPIEKMIL